ncbi:uncharacterized protein LOC111395250 [Olea europaea var. sylvestris]|uniref:uncharacterized protein LOC111395250 n=1 Tax=Olea europaea var. sylvestris TaxID=158386 RepID=UPI000C1D7EBF|nr:uncharacterized protein LOC111395250 [Olea europaea var. sylvestris]
MATLGLSTNLCGNNQCQLQQFLSPLYCLPISHSNSITAHYQQKIHLLIILLYVIFVFHFSIFATASITYSTFHGFYNRPVCFISSIRYILFSIFPLLLTVVASLIILIFVFIIFGLLGALVYEGLLILGVEVDYGSNYLLILVVRVPILVLVATFYLQVEWSLAHVVVVVEYKWGFAPLKRSAYLIKGNEWIAAIIEIVLCSCCISIGYCKVLHGEMTFEIADESSADYVILPVDMAKIEIRIIDKIYKRKFKIFIRDEEQNTYYRQAFTG